MKTPSNPHSTVISPTYSPTLFLHGFTGSSASWSRVIASAPLGATIVCVDLPGHGNRPVMRGFSANLASLVDELDPRIRYRVVGYSLGARVALGLLESAPERIAELVLIGVNPGLSEAGERDARRRADADLAGMLRTHGIDTFLAHWNALPLFASQADLDPAVRAGQQAIRRRHDPEGLARCLEELGLAEMPDYRPLIATAEVPITLVVGGRDDKFLALARELDRPLQVVEGAGHNVPLEAPEALGRLLFP